MGKASLSELRPPGFRLSTHCYSCVMLNKPFNSFPPADKWDQGIICCHCHRGGASSVPKWGTPSPLLRFSSKTKYRKGWSQQSASWPCLSKGTSLGISGPQSLGASESSWSGQAGLCWSSVPQLCSPPLLLTWNLLLNPRFQIDKSKVTWMKLSQA